MVIAVTVTSQTSFVCLSIWSKLYSYESKNYWNEMFLLQNQILWIDEKNLTARVEAGIVGQDLERLVSIAHPSSSIQWKHLF